MCIGIYNYNMRYVYNNKFLRGYYHVRYAITRTYDSDCIYKLYIIIYTYLIQYLYNRF